LFTIVAPGALPAGAVANRHGAGWYPAWMKGLRYLFHDFCLEPAARELRRNGELIVLPVSAIDCLAYLITHRERAVGRDELIAAVWGRTDVADTLLAQTVLRIRRALGETGGEQSSIRTVQRFGYRWAAPTRVEESAVEAAEPVDSPEPAVEPPDDVADVPPAPAPAQPRRRSFGVLVAAALLLLAALAGGWWWRTQQTASTATQASSGATAYVMPAQVPAGAESNWLRLGLMDLIADRLRAGGLATAPAESVLALLKQSGASPPTLAGALEVNPTVRFRDGRWHVSLVAQRGDERALAEAESDDVLAAARSAADQLLIRLGHRPPSTGNASSALALQELLQRTRAAILADQFDLARSLIAQAAPELQQSPQIALRQVQIEMGEGHYESVERQAAALLDRLPQDAGATLRGSILNLLGGAQVRLGRHAEADTSYDEAVRVLGAVDDPIGLANAWSGRAAIAAQRDDLERATAELGRARVEFAAGADVLGAAHVDMNLGLVAAQRYRVAQAEPMLREVQARLREIGAREESVYASYALTGVELQLLDYAAARALSDATWPPSAHTGNERLRWQLVVTRAQLLLAEGRLGEATTLLAQIESESSPTQDAATRAIARALTARVAFERGNAVQAAELAAQALTPVLRSEEPDVYLRTWLLQARALRRSGRLDEAAQQTAALRAFVDSRPSEWRQLQAVLAEAEQASAEGRNDAALMAFGDAGLRADRLGVPDDRVEVVAAAVPALLAQNLVDEASALVGAIAVWAPHDFRAAWVEAQLARARGRDGDWQQARERAAALARERAEPGAYAQP
jgi:DNA-binding winged helix-turn-helix (wHTH) protein/tetratricopeptide (TPR) repeat protein